MLPQVIEQTCDPEIEWVEDPQRADGRTYRGHAGVRDSFERWLEGFDEYSFELEEIIDCGENVLVVTNEQLRRAHDARRQAAALPRVLRRGRRAPRRAELTLSSPAARRRQPAPPRRRSPPRRGARSAARRRDRRRDGRNRRARRARRAARLRRGTDEGAVRARPGRGFVPWSVFPSVFGYANTVARVGEAGLKKGLNFSAAAL